MFPLSENAVEILQISVIFSICAASFSIAPRWIAFYGVPIVVAALAYNWQRNELIAINADNISYGIMLMGVLLLVAASAFWAFVVLIVIPFFVRQSQRFPSWKPKLATVLFLAISPALVMTVNSFVRQIVPSSGKCVNDRIGLSLGTHQLEMRHDFKARITLSAHSESNSFGAVYSTVPAAKESLKLLCSLSENGKVSIPVDEITMYPASIAVDLANKCTDSTRFSKEFCLGLDKTDFQRVTSIRLTNSPQKYLLTMSSWFSYVDDPSVSTGGDMENGFVCHGTDNTTDPVYCTVWFPLDQYFSVVARSSNAYDLALSGTTKADVLAKIRDSIGFALKAFELENLANPSSN